jgi:hypothetical protein
MVDGRAHMAKKKVSVGARGEIDFLRGSTDRTIFYKDTEVKGSKISQRVHRTR